MISNKSGEGSDLGTTKVKPIDLMEEVQKKVTESYHSRRDRQYDDDQSDDELIGIFKDSINIDIHRRDTTTGDNVAIKPHPMFKNNRSQFSALLK